MSGRTVFLTGATGFIGRRVARELSKRGDGLRCLVRNRAKAEELRLSGAELIEGDVNDGVAMARGLDGADCAIHLAATYDIGVVDSAAMQRANVGGTAEFISAIEKAGTTRALYVSTTVALGPVSAGIGDESSRNHPPFSSEYERTKTEAHELARSAQQGGSPLMIACPAYVYGPGDNGPGGRFLHDLVRRRVPGLLSNPAWFSFVHVDDVVAGLLAVLDRGTAGETYVLSGEAATINSFAAQAAALAGVSAPFLRFPPPLARATGTLLDGVTRATGIRFPITRENVNTVAGHRWLHAHTKATEELGWRPRPLSTGLPETIAWLRSRSGGAFGE